MAESAESSGGSGEVKEASGLSETLEQEAPSGGSTSDDVTKLLVELCLKLDSARTLQDFADLTASELVKLASFDSVRLLRFVGLSESEPLALVLAARGRGERDALSELPSGVGKRLADFVRDVEEREAVHLEAAKLKALGLGLGTSATDGLWVTLYGGREPVGALVVTGSSESLRAEISLLRAISNVISCRIRAEEDGRSLTTIQSSQESFRRIVENLTELLFVVDRDWKVVFANPKAEATLGISFRSMVRRHLDEVFRTIDGKPAAEQLVSVCGEKNPLELEIHGLLDRHVRLELRANPVAYAGLNGFLITALDVTENRHLQQRFLHAQRMEAVGRLAGGFSHDFNNILTAINGYGQLVLEDVKDPAIRANVEEICKAGRRASALTDKLLVFSRRKGDPAGKFSLNELLAELRPVVMGVLREDIAVVSLFGEDLPQVAVDPSEAEQVILNLVVNAQDAMPEGGRIRLSTRRREIAEGEVPGLSEGVYAEVELADNGTGIPAEIQERIFEPFFSTKESMLGTGLGLSTVYGIVTQIRGHIEVVSTVGQGSTFRVLFPECEAEDGGEQRREPAAAAPTTPSAENNAERRILLVEDDDALRRFFQVCLERIGYQVLVSSDGEEALEIFESRSDIDLVVSDVVMPRMGGREFVERIRKGAGDVPVILVTGYARSEDGVEELRSRYTVLSKPLKMADLQKAVEESLQGRG